MRTDVRLGSLTLVWLWLQGVLGGITLLLKAPHTTGYIVVSISCSQYCFVEFVLQRCIGYIHLYSPKLV